MWRQASRRLSGDGLTNVAGLAIAAVFPFLALPFLSRLFSAAEFGVFGTITSLSFIASTFAAGRYENAIVVPERDETAALLSYAGGFCIAFTSLVLVLLLPIVLPWFGMADLLLEGVLGVGIAALAAAYQLVVNCAIRLRRFRSLAASRVTVGIAQAALGILAGALGWGPTGLLASLLAAYIVGNLVLLWMVRSLFVGRFNANKVWQTAVDYRRYPLLNIPSTVANSVANNLPILFLSTFYGSSVAGQFAMLMRVWAGTGIIAKGVGEVFRQRASVEMQALGQFRNAYLNTAVPLSMLAVLLFTSLFFLGPWLFVLFLGDEWRDAGVYAVALAPYLCVQMVASTMSFSYFVADRLRALMIWQFALLVVQLLTLSATTSTAGPLATLQAFSVASTLMYGIYLAGSFLISRGATKLSQ